MLPTSMTVIKEPICGYLDCKTQSNIGFWWVPQGKGTNPTSMTVIDEPTRGYLDCNTQSNIDIWWVWSKMTLNYWVVVERYLFLSGVVGGSIPTMKFSLYLTGKN